MDRLKQMLDTINFNYTERIFESEDGIAGLGPEPFVSELIISYPMNDHLIITSHLQDPSIRIHIIAAYAVHARSLLCKVAPPTKESIHEACLHVYFPLLHVLPTGKQTETSLPSSPVPYLWVVCPGLVAT